MPSTHSDQEIMIILREKIKVDPNFADSSDDGKVIKLDLSGLDLTNLPPEITQLTNLQQLDLHNTQLSQLPAEIGQLTNLQRLDLLKEYCSPREARANLKDYLRFYNEQRVHQSLESRTPAEIYFANSRKGNHYARL